MNRPASEGLMRMPPVPSPAPSRKPRGTSSSESNPSLALDYSSEPCRKSYPLIVRKDAPYNAEPPLEALVKSVQTPTPHLFVRQHGPVPDLHPDDHTIVFQGLGIKHGHVKLSVSDIKNTFEKVETTAVLMCAGNRRDGLQAVKPVQGVIWGPGTVGNCRWTGARLCQVLEYCGLPTNPLNRSRALHCAFNSVECCEEDANYGSSIPLDKAMDPLGDVLLAYELNGEPLCRDHGAPVRLVVPGFIGARWVKYLAQVTIQTNESDAFYQQEDYKLLPALVDSHLSAEEWWSKLPAIQEINVQSVICYPKSGQVLPLGPVTIKGYALTGGGRSIERVDVSIDCGETWDVAKLNNSPCKNLEEGGQGPCWGWSFFEYTVDSLPDGCEIVCRAFDTSQNTQPDRPLWNYRGVMNNALFRVKDVIQREDGKV
ncbi:hypothetical protein SeMB42_g03789 [Synchytrium endobioticum]|uniref:Sulfite oxidase n=1 Tax=Synchytrium endobioticum TaxID=286115 RepID=A0A507D407_9FUNG|nr:hypothetical protein SeMB42_g03789 [Synchytrium endobioticum]TPX48332.1 hypothetical protein SeLEV6574_g02089 [Synchytrium endobioticum]